MDVLLEVISLHALTRHAKVMLPTNVLPATTRDVTVRTIDALNISYVITAEEMTATKTAMG